MLKRIPKKSIWHYQWESGISHGSLQQLLKEMNWSHTLCKLSCEDCDIRMEFMESLSTSMDSRGTKPSVTDSGVRLGTILCWLFCQKPLLGIQRNKSKPSKNWRQGLLQTYVVTFIIVRSLVYTSSMNAEKYVNTLKNFVLVIICLGRCSNCVSLAAGATPLFAITWGWLSNGFPGPVIGHCGNVEWPPRSSDLTLLDFLWGYLTKRCKPGILGMWIP